MVWLESPAIRNGRLRGGRDHADELLIDRTNQTFQGNGHAQIKMPGQSLGTSGFLPRLSTVATNSSATTNQFVIIDFG